MTKIYGPNEVEVSFGVDEVEKGGNEHGLARTVHFSVPGLPTLLTMTHEEWVRICALTVLDRDMEARAAYFAQAKAWKELQAAVEVAGLKIAAEIAQGKS